MGLGRHVTSAAEVQQVRTDVPAEESRIVAGPLGGKPTVPFVELMTGHATELRPGCGPILGADDPVARKTSAYRMDLPTCVSSIVACQAQGLNLRRGDRLRPAPLEAMTLPAAGGRPVGIDGLLLACDHPALGSLRGGGVAARLGRRGGLRRGNAGDNEQHQGRGSGRPSCPGDGHASRAVFGYRVSCLSDAHSARRVNLRRCRCGWRPGVSIGNPGQTCRAHEIPFPPRRPAPLVVEAHDPLGSPWQVRHDEADAREQFSLVPLDLGYHPTWLVPAAGLIAEGWYRMMAFLGGIRPAGAQYRPCRQNRPWITYT